MVKKIFYKGKYFYQCKECKFVYEDKKLAEKCQFWCRKNHSCNMEIIKYAIDTNNK